MTNAVDPDVKKAIEAHRQQTIFANNQINLLNVQIEGLSMKHRRSELVELELQSLPDGTVTYRSLGRMFIKKDKAAILDDIVNERSEVTKSVESLKKTKQTIAANLEGSKDALRELLNSRQQS
ncbi:unnamed protein product [Dicrocoelium dendriticum]|nr:unnamed protein product [Dicrocoelium dendriticum]